MSHELCTLNEANHTEVATLLHQSLVEWYQTHLNQGERFGNSAIPFELIPQVYHELDPHQAIAVRDSMTQRLLGVCFYHPRVTHVAIGIVAVHPQAAGRGIARFMMQEAIRRAENAGLPLRLVSSLLNLDSYSLYTKLGFVPQTLFQDLLLQVPQAGLSLPTPSNELQLRLADLQDAQRITDFEYSLQRVQRLQDWQFFLENQVGDWRVWIAENAQHQIQGVLVASHHPHQGMLGPGCCIDEETAIQLLGHALNQRQGQQVVFLIPAQATKLLVCCYQWKARTIEMHVSQVRGPAQIQHGIAFPTFLPESA